MQGWDTTGAAVVGGTTTVIDFANQEIGKSMTDSVRDYRANKIDGITCCDILCTQ